MSARDLNHNGFEERWCTTAELARQFGFPVRHVQDQVQQGELIPTWRTPAGKPRWLRADFARQTAPTRPEARVPPPAAGPEGSLVWRGAARVTAQPERLIAVESGRQLMYLDVDTARQLAATLPAAIEVAERPDPACTCRTLRRHGDIQMIVPTPTCPIHQGATP